MSVTDDSLEGIPDDKNCPSVQLIDVVTLFLVRARFVEARPGGEAVSLDCHGHAGVIRNALAVIALNKENLLIW